MKTLDELKYKAYRQLLTLLGLINPAAATKELYKSALGHELNLENPQDFTEKMQWLKLNVYADNPLVTQCADKYKVREYIESKGCPEILNELYGVWLRAEDINWEELPERFVLKCNHGCGFNIICTDKSSLDTEHAKNKLNAWMKKEYGLKDVELVYRGIPRRIICERYIDAVDEGELKDYKLFCSYGTPKLIYVISGGRGEGEMLDYYTPDWEWIPVVNSGIPNAGDVHKRPETLGEMLKYAAVLSKDFPIVRVDLYSASGKIIFGELTFLATGGMSVFSPPEYDRMFGELFPLDTEKARARKI